MQKKSDLIIKKPYLGYFSGLVDEYNNTYHRSIGKKPIYVDYSALIEKLNRFIQLLNSKLVIESG